MLKHNLLLIIITFFLTLIFCFLQSKFKSQKGGLLKVFGIVFAIIICMLIFWVFMDFKWVERGFSFSFNNMEVIKERWNIILAFLYSLYVVLINK